MQIGIKNRHFCGVIMAVSKVRGFLYEIRVYKGVYKEAGKGAFA